MFNEGKALIYRRDYKRYILNDSIYLLTKEDRERHAILKDLSARGAGIIGDSPLEINEKVTAVISAPFFFDEPVRRRATIAWCKRIDKNLWQSGLDFGIDNKIEL